VNLKVLLLDTHDTHSRRLAVVNNDTSLDVSIIFDHLKRIVSDNAPSPTTTPDQPSPPKEIKISKGDAIETTSTAITAAEITSTTTTPVERSKTPTVYKSPKSPGQVHIAIATMRVGIEEKWGVEMTDRVYWNHQYYCKVHGYDYYVLDESMDSSREPAYSKIKWMQKLLFEDDYPYVMWMDYDSLFMNFSVSIYDMFDAAGWGVDFIGVAGKSHFLNTGHFIMRNSEWSRQFLESVWEVYPHRAGYWDQGAINVIIHGGDPKNSSTWVGARGQGWVEDFLVEVEDYIDDDMKPYVKILPKHMMNDYSQGWKKPHWIVHAAGKKYKPHFLQRNFHDMRKQMYPWYPQEPTEVMHDYEYPIHIDQAEKSST